MKLLVNIPFECPYLEFVFQLHNKPVNTIGGWPLRVKVRVWVRVTRTNGNYCITNFFKW